MTQSNTREEGFERLIERALVGSTIEERALEGIELNASFADAQAPTENQFYWGIPSDFDKRKVAQRGTHCLVVAAAHFPVTCHICKEDVVDKFAQPRGV